MMRLGLPGFLTMLAGVGLVALGVFLPIAEVSGSRAVDFFNDGEGDGALVLFFSVVAVGWTLIRWHYRALAAIIIATLITLYDVFVVLGVFVPVRRSAFAGLASAAPGTVQLSYGWIVIGLGLALLLGGWVWGTRNPRY